MSVKVRLCAMEEKLSIMNRRISSIDSRLSSMDSRESSMDSKLSSTESKLDYLIKLFSSAYNTTGVQLDEEDDQYFDEVGGEGVSVGDAYRTCDKRIDHAANHLVPPVSISSSPIAESEHSMKIFTQMSDRKLAGSLRKRRAARTIESSYDCQSLRRKMIHTLPMSGSVTFDPYRPITMRLSSAVSHFMDREWRPGHIETVTQLIRQHKDKYPEVFDEHILCWITDYPLDFFNSDKENYNFGEEMLEFLNEKEPMMNIKPCAAYDRVNIGVVQFIGEKAWINGSVVSSKPLSASNAYVSIFIMCCSVDCDVFVLKYTEFLMVGRELNFTADDIVQFRKKYA
ncbi:hypothetical protein FNV43_RR03537 [Rhamnella rubrinervis]|uniref:Uncharacterized protein n=1 Tax=Rhamnella rubrinervis TaxID=2594499 RepID=A0A8K0HK64_9ROSA|nr:hypothetical protein FNV43_RR03537 [Rhamnella rubrinervis]